VVNLILNHFVINQSAFFDISTSRILLQTTRKKRPEKLLVLNSNNNYAASYMYYRQP
jgi:hypothetical protein